MTTQFKPGDRVRYIGVGEICTPRCIGWTGIVTKVLYDRDTIQIAWDNGSQFNRSTLLENLELIPKSNQTQDSTVSDLLNKLEAEIQTAQSTLQKLRELLG